MIQNVVCVVMTKPLVGNILTCEWSVKNTLVVREWGQAKWRGGHKSLKFIKGRDHKFFKTQGGGSKGLAK